DTSSNHQPVPLVQRRAALAGRVRRQLPLRDLRPAPAGRAGAVRGDTAADQDWPIGPRPRARASPPGGLTPTPLPAAPTMLESGCHARSATGPRSLAPRRRGTASTAASASRTSARSTPTSGPPDRDPAGGVG